MSIFKSFILFFGFMLMSLTIFAQSDQSKDQGLPSIYPTFEEGMVGLSNFYRKEISPLLARNTKNPENLPTSLQIVLTVDTTGRVAEVDFLRGRMEAKCKRLITRKIRNMKGWSPGKENGRAVVSKYPWYISCILWSQ